jgi:hypothetical protein
VLARVQRRTRDEVEQEQLKREHGRQYYCQGDQGGASPSSDEPDPTADKTIQQEDAEMDDDEVST